MRLYNSVIPEYKSGKDKENDKNKVISLDDENNQDELMKFIANANRSSRNGRK